MSDATVSAPASTKSQLSREIRARIHALVHDETGTPREATHGLTAIYTLSDPRDLRAVRYVGQSRAPRRRLLQHLQTARLFIPDEIPWWVPRLDLRPLYEWIRELHRDGSRLPVMIVTQWVEAHDALAAERALLRDCVRRDLALLNAECRASGPQIPLL